MDYSVLISETACDCENYSDNNHSLSKKNFNLGTWLYTLLLPSISIDKRIQKYVYLNGL